MLYSDLQLFRKGIKIEKNCKYKLILTTILNKACVVKTQVHQHPSYISIQKPDFNIFDFKQGINQLEKTFNAVDNNNNARLTLYFGDIEKDTEIIIEKIELIKILTD
jgi:hypothetical protein